MRTRYAPLFALLAACAASGPRGGNISTGGAQDFGAFRAALDRGEIPNPASLDAAGFFAEHQTTLPPPTCGSPLCPQALLALGPDLVHGGDRTLLQIAINTPINPDTYQRPPVDLALVLDRSGSMASSDKMAYARKGAALLVDSLAPHDTLTLLTFDDKVETLFGPAPVADKPALKSLIEGITPRGGTAIYDGLSAGYDALAGATDETRPRRVLFLTDGRATVGLGADVDAPLLRDLAEAGGGNFYFVEDPTAVTEVFTAELSYFIAPIAYDVDLTLDPLPTYDLLEVHGSHLWKSTATGGALHIPSAYLVSRKSPDPDPNGGRRGGGSALLAELAETTALTGPRDLATLHLSYRLPNQISFQSEDLTISWDGATHPFYTAPSAQKNAQMLDFYLAFRDATQLAPNNRPAALTLLQAFRSRIAPLLLSSTDADLLDDLALLDQYIAILS